MTSNHDASALPASFKGRRILLTGAAGFMGRHMAAALLEAGAEVWGLEPATSPSLPAGVRPILGNLLDPGSLQALDRSWDGVIHLAALSIPSLIKGAAEILQNVAMTIHLLDHLEPTRILLVSSAHVYAPSLEPRAEDSAIRPQGRYGLSKHLTEQLACAYRARHDIRIARPFNHVGPGLRPELMLPSLLHRLAALDPRGDSPVQMAGTNSVRDFIDARDVASAYLRILGLENPEHRVFNVCTGRAVTIREVVSLVLDLLGQVRPVVFEDRPNSADDNPFLVGRPDRLEGTGWNAVHSLRDSLNFMLNSTF